MCFWRPDKVLLLSHTRLAETEENNCLDAKTTLSWKSQFYHWTKCRIIETDTFISRVVGESFVCRDKQGVVFGIRSVSLLE